jgi:hypothetical protein
MKFSLEFKFFACFFRFLIFFCFILGSFSHQTTVFASLQNEAKQTLFFAISLPVFSLPCCYFSLQAKIWGHPNYGNRNAEENP